MDPGIGTRLAKTYTSGLHSPTLEVNPSMKLTEPDAVTILEVARHPGYSTMKEDGRLVLRANPNASPLPVRIIEGYLSEVKAVAGAWLCLHAEGCVELKVAKRQLDKWTWEGFGVTNHGMLTDFPLGTWPIGEDEDNGAVLVIEPRYRWPPKPDAISLWRNSNTYLMRTLQRDPR
jgi:hypothetical protein